MWLSQKIALKLKYCARSATSVNVKYEKHRFTENSQILSELK